MCLDSIERFDQIKPFKIIGFEASWTLFSTLASASLSFLSTLVIIISGRYALS